MASEGSTRHTHLTHCPPAARSWRSLMRPNLENELSSILDILLLLRDRAIVQWGSKLGAEPTLSSRLLHTSLLALLGNGMQILIAMSFWSGSRFFDFWNTINPELLQDSCGIFCCCPVSGWPCGWSECLGTGTQRVLGRCTFLWLGCWPPWRLTKWPVPSRLWSVGSALVFSQQGKQWTELQQLGLLSLSPPIPPRSRLCSALFPSNFVTAFKNHLPTRPAVFEKKKRFMGIMGPLQTPP